MQPAPPPRMFASRKVSLPAKTSKPSGWKCFSIASVLLQSPRAVLHAGDGAGVGLEQALDQRQADRHLGHRGNMVEVDLQACVGDRARSPRRSCGTGLRRSRPCNRTAAASARRAQPACTAWRVSSTVSLSAQAPVPGIMRAAGRPASSSASSRRASPPAVSELASELVPKTASPTFCFNSQLQCRVKRATDGMRSLSKGVRTGENTPRSRVVVMRIPKMEACEARPVHSREHAHQQKQHS